MSDAEKKPDADDEVPPRDDFTHLTQLAVVDDRFRAEELAALLAEENFDVSIVSSSPTTLGTLTAPGPVTYGIVVPEHEADRAEPLLTQWIKDLDGSAAQSEKAAEDEEAAGEKAVK